MIDPATLGKALGARLAEIRVAMARYDSFAYQLPGDTPDPGPDEKPRGGEDAGYDEAARVFVLSALRVASDPLSYALLRRMADGDTTLSELGATAGLPRLVVWDRLATLVAAGLAGRSLETDSAGLTPAGATLVALVEETTAAAAESFR